MSLSQYGRVKFPFGDRHLVGDAIEFLPAGDVSGPNGLLVVDVDGFEYRVAESDVTRLDR